MADDDRYGPGPPTLVGTPVEAVRTAGRRRSVPGWLIAVAAATAVASVTAFAAVLFWPAGGGDGDDPLAFHPFVSVGRLDVDDPSRSGLTSVLGDRGYAAWDQDGDLRVVAFDIDSGTVTEQWDETVTGAPRWSWILAVPDGLLVTAYEPDLAERRRMFKLDAQTGEEQWHEDVRGDDRLYLIDGTLAWLSRDRHELRGLDLAEGRERWRLDFPEEAMPAVLPVLSEAELDRPADRRGVPGPGTGDSRLVLVHPDRSAQVIDGSSGRVLSEGGNVADPDDLLLGYQDRLFVAPEERGYQLVSYRLEELARVPQTHYVPPDEERHPEELAPCGAGRVCLLENVSFDRATTEVVTVDAAGGGQLWRAPAPEAEQLLGVGQWVVAVTDPGFDPSIVVYDGGGALAWQGSGLAVRLNQGNLLVLTELGSGGGVRVAGVAIEGWDGEPANVGRLPAEVLGEACSWNERFLVCPDRGGAEIRQFAGGA